MREADSLNNESTLVVVVAGTVLPVPSLLGHQGYNKDTL